MSTDDNGEKIMWSKTRQLVVSIEDPSAMLISTAYGGIPKRLDLHRRSRRSSDAAAILETIPLAKGLRKHGIVLAKKKDLLSLCDTRHNRIEDILTPCQYAPITKSQKKTDLSRGIHTAQYSLQLKLYEIINIESQVGS